MPVPVRQYPCSVLAPRSILLLTILDHIAIEAYRQGEGGGGVMVLVLISSVSCLISKQ
jgi:hypothetical protein